MKPEPIFDLAHLGHMELLTIQSFHTHGTPPVAK
jgi:hypothetical protein